MRPSVAAPSQVEPAAVALRVSDLTASQEFFQELFGLQPAYGSCTPTSVLLVSPVPGHRCFSIRLTTDAVPVTLVGVHVELETANELLDLYFLALLGGRRVSELRFRRGSLATTIADPDGHLIEIEAHYGGGAVDSLRPRPAPRASREIPGRGAGEAAVPNPGLDESRRSGSTPSRAGESRGAAPERLAR